jgi:hypothetical protein
MPTMSRLDLVTASAYPLTANRADMTKRVVAPLEKSLVRVMPSLTSTDDAMFGARRWRAG